MMRKTMVRGVCAVLMLTEFAGAQGEARDPRLETRLDPETRAAVAAIVDSAKLVGLPVEPLIDKALEGASKRAPGARIISAVRNVAGELGVARDALGPGTTEAEIVAGAKVLRSGVPKRTLQQYRTIRPSRVYTPLVVLADLIDRGVPADTASAVLTSLLNVSASDEQLLALRADVERDILAGLPPASATSVRGRGVETALAALPPNNGATPGTALPSRGGTTAGGPGSQTLPTQAVGSVSPAQGGAVSDPQVVQPPPRPAVPPRGKPKRRP